MWFYYHRKEITSLPFYWHPNKTGLNKRSAWEVLQLPVAMEIVSALGRLGKWNLENSDTANRSHRSLK